MMESGALRLIKRSCFLLRMYARLVQYLVCHPISHTRRETLIEQQRLDSAFLLYDHGSDGVQIWHAENGVES